MKKNQCNAPKDSLVLEVVLERRLLAVDRQDVGNAVRLEALLVFRCLLRRTYRGHAGDARARQNGASIERLLKATLSFAPFSVLYYTINTAVQQMATNVRTFKTSNPWPML